MKVKKTNNIPHLETHQFHIHIQHRSTHKKIPSRYYFQRWISAALIQQRKSHAELTIRIVDRPEGARLNKKYRYKTGATNVLSFPFDAPSVIQLPLLGDIVICAPVIAQEAKQQHKLLKAHWAHIVIHGVLHLLGYDHIKNKEAVIMENIEINILAKLGFPNPYE